MGESRGEGRGKEKEKGKSGGECGRRAGGGRGGDGRKYRAWGRGRVLEPFFTRLVYHHHREKKSHMRWMPSVPWELLWLLGQEKANRKQPGLSQESASKC